MGWGRGRRTIGPRCPFDRTSRGGRRLAGGDAWAATHEIPLGLDVLFAETDDGLRYWQWILSGLGWTITVGLGALIIALLLGSILGVMRTTQSRALVFIGDLYIDIFRNIPLIVQLFLWFFVLPELLPKGAGDFMKQKLPDWVIAIGGLGLFTAARISEQVKSGINTLSRGQRFAGLRSG